MQNRFFISNLISECLHTLKISTIIFINFILLDKKWQRLQYCNFHQCQHIFAVARWNHPNDVALLGSWVVFENLPNTNPWIIIAKSLNRFPWCLYWPVNTDLITLSICSSALVVFVIHFLVGWIERIAPHKKIKHHNKRLSLILVHTSEIFHDSSCRQRRYKGYFVFLPSRILKEFWRITSWAALE